MWARECPPPRPCLAPGGTGSERRRPNPELGCLGPAGLARPREAAGRPGSVWTARQSGLERGLHLKPRSFAFDRSPAALRGRLRDWSTECDFGPSSWQQPSHCTPCRPPTPLPHSPGLWGGPVSPSSVQKRGSKREGSRTRAVLREGGRPFWPEVHREAPATPRISAGLLGSAASVSFLQTPDQRP